MWPMGHLAVAYLLYSGYRRLGANRLPAGVSVILVAVGSQLPDLVDKPLSWYLGMLPTGRSFAHSLLVLVPLSGLAYAIGRRYGRTDAGVALAIGALSHVIVDAVPAIWGDAQATFLLWPALPVEPYESGPPSVLAMFRESLSSLYFLLEIGLVVLAGLLWRQDGYPGIGAVLQFVVSAGGRVERAVRR